jgi:hypothetical protein
VAGNEVLTQAVFDLMEAVKPFTKYLLKELNERNLAGVCATIVGVRVWGGGSKGLRVSRAVRMTMSALMITKVRFSSI